MKSVVKGTLDWIKHLFGPQGRTSTLGRSPEEHKEEDKKDLRGKRVTSEVSVAESDEIRLVIKKRKKMLDENEKLPETPPLTCPVCADYIVSASTATCGHTYCERCLTEWIIFSKEFSLVKEAEPGTKLDIRDSEYIWCVGVVRLKIAYPTGPPGLLIHYEGWDRKYDEMITLNDPRIAPLGFFTSRKDIPKYILDGSGRCKSGYVVLGTSADYEKYSKLMSELNNLSDESESEQSEEENDQQNLE